ncbi:MULTISPECIES: hypothetical protein [unclassified Rhizobium]|uniref:hypothetical protein n=1 Tax=unclassified Rhizobium TaxID=2613769 RepID=UPI000BE8E1BF|nr:MULTISPECIES: hypothetical protein [unclassified Rhizobium]MDF0663671.1 hypothetical protein [Rhizobium sp. BC49]PDS80421.1 hypothetical protein CO654_30955 [Rhizobium sp. L18]
MNLLSQIAGKTILIIGEADFLSNDAREALAALNAAVVGPIMVSNAMERLKEEQIFDAVVIDIAISDEAMLWMNAWLETREIPFIFARDQRSQELPGGFVLSGAASDLTDIVASLFGPVSPSYH